MMNRDWESSFVSWKIPPSDTEDQRCQNAEDMIKDALESDPILSGKKIEVFAQGSYKNNTNVRQDSDVDICVRLMDVFFIDLPAGKERSDFGLNPSSYSFDSYKASVYTALMNKFGSTETRGANKVAKIKSNTYRVQADVLACFEHRRYTGKTEWDGTWHYYSGVESWTNDNERIINWPLHHFKNGVEKNNRTGRRFKHVVRILKKLRNEMVDEGESACARIPSFLIECLVWNTPDEILTKYESYVDTVRDVLVYLYSNTKNPDKCDEWGEVNELVYLFRDQKKWTKQDVTDFTVAAWNYIGFE